MRKECEYFNIYKLFNCGVLYMGSSFLTKLYVSDKHRMNQIHFKCFVDCVQITIFYYSYFRVVVLENGLKALLISDVDADAENSISSDLEKMKPHSPMDAVRFHYKNLYSRIGLCKGYNPLTMILARRLPAVLHTWKAIFLLQLAIVIVGAQICAVATEPRQLLFTPRR